VAKIATTALAVAVLGMVSQVKAADEYWRTDGTSGTWTSTGWNIGSATATGGTGWTPGNNAVFSANSTVTYVTGTSFGNVTVNDGFTATITAAGTASANSHIYNVGTGSLLTWSGQNYTASGTSFVKSGTGTWDAGSIGNAYTGGLTINAGTIIVSGNNSLGAGALNLNGGTIQSSSTRAFAATSITIGGDFALSGTGNANWDLATTIALGAATRTINNNTTSGSRQFRGLISGTSGSGLTFAGSGGAQVYIGNTGNTFDGPIAISGAEVVFNDNGSFGASTSITLDGGRLTMGTMDTAGTVTALTAATINSAKNLFVGASAGTSISVSGSTGVTTYNGVIANKPSSTGMLVKQGAGKLVLGGVSTYSGNTTNNNGTIQLTTGNNRLPTGTVFAIGASGNTCVLDLNGQSQQFAGLYSQTATANTVSSTAAATLTITGDGLFGGATPGVISGAIGLTMNGSSKTLTLGGVNTYTGETTITAGTVALSGSGSIANTPNITIAAGGTFDVSGLTAALTLGNSQTLKASGSGSAGTIATTTSKGLTLGATSGLQFTAYNGANAPLTVTGASSVTLAAGNVVTVTVPGAALGAGDYKLISSAGGANTVAVNGTAPSSVTVNGAGGLVGGTTASLVIIGGELFLHVSSSTTPVSISLQPVSLTNNVNSSAVFSVTAGGTGPLAYFWQRTNSGTGNFTNTVDAGTISGSSTASFTNSSVQVADASAYRVVITNVAGAVTSSVVTLTVVDPAITTQPVSLTKRLTETATFTVSAVGNSLSYQWYKGASPLSTGGDIYGATTATLTLSNLISGSAGNYTVVVTDSSGSVTSSVAVLTMAPAFAVGHLVVNRIGDGSGTLGSTGTAVFMDEYTGGGTLVQSVALATNGANATVNSGSASSEGALARATDGSVITLGAYNANSGTAGIASTTSVSVPRVAVTLNVNGISALAATTASQFSGANIRSTATDGTNNFWAVGQTSGTYYLGTNSTAATVQSAIANSRVISTFNGNLYFSAGAAGNFGVYQFTGLPTGSATPTKIIDTTASSSPYAFAFNAANTVAYIADDAAITSGGGIQKWTNNAGTWSLAYTLTNAGTGSRGLTVDFTGANPVIYATTTESQTNRLFTITDTNVNATATTLATAAVNTVFRGVSFAPVSLAVYTVTGGTNCGSVTVGLSGSQVGVSYQLQTNSVNFGTPVAGTGSAITFGSQTAAGSYTVVATEPGGLSAVMTGNAIIYAVPTANNVTYTFTKGVSFKLPVAQVLTNASGTGGVTLAGFDAISANGISISSNNGSLFYNHTLTNSDSFSYTVVSGTGGCTASGLITINTDNSYGGQTNATVSVTNNVATVTMFGIAGYQYVTDRSTNLTTGTGWVPINTNMPSSDGPFQVNDDYSIGLGGVPPTQAFYHLRYQP
jgi:autotransporter-associated beta strand protein